MADTSTIYALSSGPGRAGVAVIRVSGSKARETVELMAPPLPKPRLAAFRTVLHPINGDALDRAVIIWFAAPLSETGEDVAEFQVHGGLAVVRAVLQALGRIPGLRLAEPGEFARRAFEHGKLDLAEVEGLADLVDAETEAQRRQALAQAAGSLSKLYEGWRTRLIEASALVEAAIDFSDEGDVSLKALEDARDRAIALRDEIGAHLNDGHRGEILRDGFRVALVGPPNAGKSSLLNALARRDAAIVSAEAGTTRDVIEVRLDLRGLPVIVADTAGIRETAGGVEREGIRRSMSAARSADLVLWLTESGLEAPPSEISRETTVVVRSKADLLPEGATDALCVSSVTGAGLDRLTQVIASRAADAVGAQDAPALTQQRHREWLEQARAALDTFLNGSARDLELRAEDLRTAAQALGRITGRVDVEDVLDEIFGRFCVGK